MTISILSGSAGLGQPASGVGSGAGSEPAPSVGSRLLAAIEQSDAQGGSADPLLSYVVGLSSQSGSTGNTNAAATYNAQGLLSQLQAGGLASDPLLNSAGTGLQGADASLPDLQGMQSQFSQLPQSSGVSASLTGAYASASGLDSTGSSSLGGLVQTNPALAFTLEDGQIEQQFLSQLG